MKRVVIDTNIFISGIGWGGLPLKILKLWENNEFILVTSLEIIDEIEKVIEELNLSKELWEEWKKLIFERASLIDIKFKLNIKLRDPHDIKFLECAVNGGASFIVSGDKDLLEKERLQNINIVSPRKFLRLFC
jgi:putative PIN family toxin of toxin-antitoxin system